MTSSRQSSSSAPTLVVAGASFQGRLSTRRGTMASVGTAVAALTIVALGLAGPAVERPAPAAATVAPSPTRLEADQFEPGLLAEARAVAAALPSPALTESQVLELSLLAEARALATRLAYRQVTVEEVLEQRLLMEARAGE